MADPRKPLAESKAPEVKPVDIDPSDPNLPEEHRKLLDTFLLAEEEKHGQKGIFKRKTWKIDEVYTLPDGRAIRLTHHEIDRTPKRYAAVIMLGADQDLPHVEQRRKEKENLGASVIYLKKDSDGVVKVCTTNQTEMKALSDDQKEALQQIISLDSSGRIVDYNKTNHDKIFAIQEICEYPSYVYRISEIKERPDKKPVYVSVGKLEFSNGRSHYIDNKTPRSPNDTRPPKKEKIAKKIQTFSPLTIRLALAELEFLTQYPHLKKRLHTKPGTVQKNEEGVIESITITQTRVAGVTLLDLLNRSNMKLGTLLLNEEEYKKLIKLTIKGVCEDRAARIIHRDIKPENIMILIENGIVKEVNIIDYGLSGTIGAVGAVGTLGFIAPEIATDKPSSAQTDDYSLGIVLRAMCGDLTVQKRQAVLFNQTVTEPNDRALYAGAQYYLHLSIQDISFPSFQSSVSPEYAELMKKILTDMTNPQPEKRLSSENALSMLDAFEQGQEAEITHSEEKEITENLYYNLDEQYDKAYKKISSIKNKEIRLLLFDEVYDQLEKFKLFLKNSINSIDPESHYFSRINSSFAFIERYQRAIQLCDRTIAYKELPSLIYDICKVLLEEKILLKQGTFLEDHKEARRDSHIDDIVYHIEENQKLVEENRKLANPQSESKKAEEEVRFTGMTFAASSSSSSSSLFSPPTTKDTTPAVKIHIDPNNPKKSSSSHR